MACGSFLLQLSAVMNVANAVVDLMGIQGSSVLVCFEDGWDVSAQVRNQSKQVPVVAQSGRLNVNGILGFTLLCGE